MTHTATTVPMSGVFAALALAAGAAYLIARSRRRGPGLGAPANEGRCRAILLAMAAAYAAVYLTLCLVRYEYLLCGLYDLGICDTVVRNLVRGRFLVDFRGVYDHFSPVFLVCVPFYWLWDDPRALFVIETAALAGAALPLYWFARRLIGDSRPALLLAAAYLLHPLLSRVNLYDFHEVVFHPLAFFVLCGCWVSGRWRAILPAAVASLCVKEDAAALVFGLGLFGLADPKRRWQGAALMALAVLWSLFAMRVYFPVLRGTTFWHYGRYPQVLGPTVVETAAAAARALARPFGELHVWHTLGLLLLPVGALALARPWACATLLAAPLSLTLFSSYVSQQILRGHYAASVLPGLFAAAAFGYRRLWRAQAKVCPAGVAAWLAACAVGCHVFFAEPAFERYYEHAFRYEPGRHLTLLSIPRRLPDPVLRWHKKVAAALARAIPGEHAVMAQNSLGYLFTHRQRLMEVQEGRDADVYLFDSKSNRGHTDPQVLRRVKERVADDPGFERLLFAGGFECWCRRGLAQAVVDRGRRLWEDAPAGVEENYLLAALAYTQGDMETAAQHLSFLADTDSVRPESVEALWMLGDAYARSGRPALAIEAFERGLELSPRFVPAHEVLARLYRLDRKPNHAKRHEVEAKALRREAAAAR